ncbi:hypothetical protein LO772_15350 [Yinghuangia sp. ASG 101]|uniref:hypothetical protein n=1 Tax=Yinghuangia sp. ASG 101 TaxID=2896848 RepID=UPI001E3660DB|nr:hypothetical protein [Yinghuangia sp. ASG 101]UGQ14821.1 hypothetical protein LO772_15350 [Yinghuangia sp. ASG 101]
MRAATDADARGKVRWSEAEPLPGREFLPYAGIAQPDRRTTWVAGSVMDENGFTPTLVAHDSDGWRDVPLPELPAGTNAQLNDLDVASPGDAVMVGDYVAGLGGYLTEHWDGTSWRASVAPAPAGIVGGSLLDVEVIAPDDVWAVGFSQIATGTMDDLFDTVIRHWDGTSWQVVDAPKVPGGTALFSLTAVSATELYAVGRTWADLQSTVMRYDGTSWTVVDLPPHGAANNELRSVAARGPGDVWAVGGSRDDQGATHALALHYDGTAWTEQRLPPGTDILDQVALTPDGIATIGNGDTAPFGLRLAHGRWTSLDIPTDPTLTVNELTIANGHITIAAVRATTTLSGVILTAKL